MGCPTKEITASTEQLVLSHALQLTALMELLEEKGILNLVVTHAIRL